MTRRPANEGTVDRRGDRYRIRFRMPDGSRRAFYSEPGASAEEADALRRALLLELSGTVDDPRAGGRTLGAWGLSWLDERERTHRDADGDRQRWNAYVAGTPISTRKLDAITPKDLRAWARRLASTRSERTGAMLDRQTVRNAWTTLRAALRAAMDAEVLATDTGAALLAVELPPPPVSTLVAEAEETIDALTLDEIDAVLALDLTPDQRSALTVGIFAGLRAGELHGLEWSRVDLARGEIVVARSRRGAPKSGKIGRVPLLRPALEALRERAATAGGAPSGLVWPATKAIPGGERVVAGCHARGFDWGWSPTRETRVDTPRVRELAARGELRIVEARPGGRVLVEYPGIRDRAGIARPITFHAATRHTCASHLLSGSWVAAGIIPRPWRLEEVSRLLRHSSVAVTERHYARFMPGALPVAAPADAGDARKTTAPSAGPPEAVSAPGFARATQASTGPALGPVGPGLSKTQAASGIRTPDLRFTKPEGALGNHDGIGLARTVDFRSPRSNDGIGAEVRAVRDLAAEVRDRIAGGDPMGWPRALELARRVIEVADAIEARALAERGEERAG